MNAVVKSDLASLPAALANVFGDAARESLGDLTQGVMASFPTISYRGKVWRIRKGGEETNYVDANGDAVQSLEFVLAKANPVFAKVYYKAAFEEGATGKPDCWSADGYKPDGNVLEPVCKTCAACPNNAWGSRISETGKKGKLCADRRRVAVVGPADLASNGADCQKFLLHIPAGSLKGLSEYAEKVLKPKGIPYYAVVTRIGFDTTQAHPVLTFKATRFLNEQEARAILKIRDGDEVARILQESHEFDGVDSEAAAATEGIAGTMPAAMASASVGTSDVAVARPAATQVAPAAAPTTAPAATPAAAPRTAVDAEIMPEPAKKTRKARTPSQAAPATVSVTPSPAPAAASHPKPAPDPNDFDAMLDSILGE